MIFVNEVLVYLEKRAGVLNGVCLTGGEPLLQKDIQSFLQDIKALGYSVKLDTNGSDPDRLDRLIDKNLLDYVAMDIKNSLVKYPETTVVSAIDLSAVKKSASLLMQGRIPFEFRTTVVNEFHTLEDIDEIGKWLQGAPTYYLQDFVDSGNLIQERLARALDKRDNVKCVLGAQVISIEEAEGELLCIHVQQDKPQIDLSFRIDGLFVAIGLVPENECFADLAQLDNFGYYSSDERCLTGTPGIFVAGDCRSKGIRQLTTAVSDGTVAAIAACSFLV